MAIKLSNAQRIRNYISAHPKATPKDIAQALKLKRQYIHQTMYADKKRVKTHEQPKVQFLKPDFPITMEEPKVDPVNHPTHYKVGGIETIDFIEAKGLTYHLGNAVKYITRADHKGNRLQDLQKAKWYLERAIAQA